MKGITASFAALLVIAGCGGGGDTTTAGTAQGPAAVKPSAYGVCNVPATYTVPAGATPIAPFLSPYFKDKQIGPAEYDACGIPSIIIWSTGEYNQSTTIIAQWGIGAYTSGDYSTAIKAANWLIAHQMSNGGFPLTFNHTNSASDPNVGFHLTAPWYSAVTQGNALSLLVRVHSITNDQAYIDAAIKALALLKIPVSAGGLQGQLNGGVWFEETPDPNYPNHIFNGSVFALLGIHDLYLATGSSEAYDLWVQGEASLRANINAHIVWAPFQDPTLPDPWMVYDLQVNGFPAVPNYLTSAYGGIHVRMYREMFSRTGNETYKLTADSLDKSLALYKATHPNS